MQQQLQELRAQMVEDIDTSKVYMEKRLAEEMHQFKAMMAKQYEVAMNSLQIQTD
jgi:hypothetical protein